ncbi:MAG TPA: hypothetical protein VFI46_16340 [Jiangellaceae bacterium]|nr:hypothetical protein [Jiangellaceae bacterium]
MRDMLAGVGIARTLSGVVTNLESAPGTDDALLELARQLRDVDETREPLSEAASYAIAAYVGVLAFSPGST